MLKSSQKQFLYATYAMLLELGSLLLIIDIFIKECLNDIRIITLFLLLYIVFALGYSFFFSLLKGHVGIFILINGFFLYLAIDSFLEDFFFNNINARLLYDTLLNGLLDLNPIEMAFPQLKAHLRKAAEKTIPELWDRIGQCLDEITPKACANYFAEAGYAPC